MITAVLDASALLATLREEPGGERVERLLEYSAMSAVNFGEVVGFYARRGAPEEEIRQRLGELPLARLPVDEELAYATGMMISATRAAGLSFGDRACLALAQRLGVKALTADRAWLQIAQAVGVEVEVIR